jgi:glycosyltransferase involved in cell wall biosynthesis
MPKLRIAVDFRFLIGGPNVVNRGTGRYTQHQMAEVLRIDRENQYLLIIHHNADLNLVLPEIRSASNVSFLRIPIANIQTQDYPNSPDRALKHIEEFQSWLSTLNIDLFHEATPYQLDELVLYQFDVCPIVTTMYDVIPLVFTDLYWPPGSLFHEELQRAAFVISRSTRLIAISESARTDANLYLGVSREKIDLAYPYADPMFRVLPKESTAAIMRQIRQRLDIPATYILSLIHIHHSKNPETLLAAYGKLPASVRKRVPLVIVFFLRDSDRALMESWTEYYGVKEHVILTGLVSDEELVALYNAATMVVHPSRYEGFGLPVVEAMACGAPVITTTAASLPEVGGDAAILVDPDDVQGFADAMEALLNDPERRSDMARRGLEHVKLFNPEQLGRHTLESYYRTLRDAVSQTAPAKPRMALWSTTPPLKCGIADYTIDLLPELSRKYDISVFVGDAYLPTQELLFTYNIHHHTAFERQHQREPFDVILYQLGVSVMHDYMYDYLRKYPGIVVIHDVNFALGFHYVYSVRENIDAFKNHVLKAEGQRALADFEQVERMPVENRQRALEAFYARYLLLRWVINSSIAQIVHMSQARDLLKTHYPEANAYVVDMGATSPWRGMPPLQTSIPRMNLGFSQSSYIIGVFGSVASIKRIEHVIEAFKHVVDAKPDSTLLIVGEMADQAYAAHLQHVAARMGLAEQVVFVGRADRASFDAYMLTIDVLVNLRYPSRQQMSATLIRGIACGKPSIITDLPEWRYFPETFCWKVAPDENEVRVLSEYLVRLAQDPELCKKMSVASLEFFRTRATTAHSAREYMRIIDEQITHITK